MEIIQWGDWSFEVHRTKTEQHYSKVKAGGADTCTCSDCRHFAEVRDKAYPDTVLDLFFRVGIDHNKESEVYTVGDNDHSETYYGWFHFVGRVLSGKDCKIPFDEISSAIEYTQMTDNFRMGFTSFNAPCIFGEYLDPDDALVQIEFETKIES